jgi:cyclopropane-fatty-acyl-phospholipid synthase
VRGETAAGWSRAGEVSTPDRALRKPRSTAWRAYFERLLADADVRLDGSRPWDPRVHDERVFRRIAARGSLAAGDSYVDGDWDCERLDELTNRLLRAQIGDRMLRSPADWLRVARAWSWNLQSIGRAGQVARRHYDLGNDLFLSMLDARAIYSCGYWRDAATLDDAQEAKLDLVARKLGLLPGMRVLDIGCGWGGAARFLAERYDVEVTGVTLSSEQARFAADYCRGFPVTIELRDYRSIEGTWDRVLSLGMFEHVGWRNYRTYLRAARSLVDRDGLFLLHTIGSSVSSRLGDAWVHRHIFPNYHLPSIAQIAAACEEQFVIEDWHNFGADYDPTLLAWHANFERAWPMLADRYGERFHRMWRYYLLTAAGGFRARHNQLWQVVLSPRGIPGGYRSPR